MGVWCFLGSAGEGNDDYELLQTVPLVEGIIGSDASCEIRLRDPLITPKHARLLKREGAWFIGGVAAMSPTLVNGVATLPGEAVQLAVGDLVELANTRFRFGGEPPMREGVDANSEVAVLMYADALAERGSPVGLRILEKQSPSPSWLPGLEAFVEGGVIVPEWTRGLLTAVQVRELSFGSLRRLLENDAAVALERLTVHLATCETAYRWLADKPEQGRLRSFLQLLGVTKPPRLRKLDLGFLHVAPRSGTERDWDAIARRLPLEGSLGTAYRLAGEPRFTMTRTCEGAPEVGVVTSVRTWAREHPPRMRVVGGVPKEQPPSLGGRDGECAGFGSKEDFTLNDWPSWESRQLIHGDVIEAETFAFRFEEDPQ